MIKRFKFNDFLTTETVVKDIIVSDINALEILTLNNNELLYKLDSKDIIYGLGENLRGLNKRGYIYESFCSDDPSHVEDKRSLYGAHNFILVKGATTFGVFIDSPHRVTFDLGYTNLDELKISVENNAFDLYLITGEVNNIVAEFRDLIGKSYLAPLFAFGFGQSRWSYPNEKAVREIIQSYNDANIPLEMLYLDIDYMERYKDFSINDEAFPNFGEFVKELKAKNVHLVPIIDAGVKIEEGYDTYEEGVKHNYFCVDKDGNPFVAAVWPGIVHFPDFLNKDARKWFGQKYKVLTDLGIDAFWNDMNEPSIFYTPSRLTEAIDYVSSFKGQTDLDLNLVFSLKDKILQLANSNEDYKRMYHNVDGKLINHYEHHNLYGYNMTRAAGEAFTELRDERTLMFSRASMIGAHRYGGIWTGDNCSWWTHLESNIKMMPNLNMCGFIYSGADTGGFGSNITEDLLLRWMQFSIFTPLLRNHACMGTRLQELFRFENSIKTFKNVVDLRYSMIPFIYSEYLKAVHNNDLLFKPLSFVYQNDELVNEIEDQIIYGNSIMLCPIYKQNTTARYIYLPEDMMLVRFKAYNDFKTEMFTKGHHYLSYNYDEVCFFILPNKAIILTEPKMSVEEIDLLDIKVLGNNSNSYEQYYDDGKSLNVEPKIRTI